MRLDHILIRVDNLEKAMTDFREMGFNIYPGNAGKKCHHAMIYFQDESFIELIDPSKFPASLTFLSKVGVLNLFGPFFRRITHYVTSGEQFLDYSVHTATIEEMYRCTKPNNKKLRMHQLKRVNHSGTKIGWKLVVSENMELPFIMSDYSPAKLPVKEAAIHPNGITGISELTIEVPNQEAYVQEFQHRFGADLRSLENTTLIIEHGDCFRITHVQLQPGEEQSVVDLCNLSGYGIRL